jgi:tRNA threonylcarbamoyladenosine biosynthesis protein TsaE
MLESIILPDEQSTEGWGSLLAQKLVPGLTLFLKGDLGAGKTTLVRGVLRGLHFAGPVKSPTFTLVEEYEFSWGVVYHFDLYRLSSPDELDFMGIRDYFTPNAIVLVEWPERGQGVLPAPDGVLDFKIPSQGRVIELSIGSEKGQQLLQSLKQSSDR